MSRPVTPEPLLEVRRRRRRAERPELDRHGVLEQRARRIVEQPLHQRRGGPREGVRRDDGLMLEDAAQDPVRAVDPEEVLELVERDEAASTRSLVELRRQVEEPEQDALDVDPRVRLERRREPAGAERQPDLPRAEQRVDRAPHRALELAVVRALDPDDDAREREHAFEVDERRRPSVGGSVGEHAAEQARLPVATGRDEPRRVASRRRARAAGPPRRRGRSSRPAAARRRCGTGWDRSRPRPQSARAGTFVYIK